MPYAWSSTNKELLKCKWQHFIYSDVFWRYLNCLCTQKGNDKSDLVMIATLKILSVANNFIFRFLFTVFLFHLSFHSLVHISLNLLLNQTSHLYCEPTYLHREFHISYVESVFVKIKLCNDKSTKTYFYNIIFFI